MRIIEELERDRVGTSDEKHLNTQEKYKFAIIYMKMLADPKRFQHLNRFLPNIQNEKTRVQLDKILPDEDVNEFKDLKKKIGKANKLTETLRTQRRKTLEQGQKG